MAPRIGIDIGSDSIKAVILEQDRIEKFPPIRLCGRSLEKTKDLLKILRSHLNGQTLRLGLTGSGAASVSSVIGLHPISELDALTESLNRFEPDSRHVIEIGAETQKYLCFSPDPRTGRLMPEDIIPGGKCAGGTGSFLDYMHRRLKYESLEEFASAGLKVENPAGISGRCAVFAESDIVHHYQKGTPKERIVAGIHQAVARNFGSLIRKGKIPDTKVTFIGGVSQNGCQAEYLKRELGLDDGQIVVSEHNLHLQALGAAMRAEEEVDLDEAILRLSRQIAVPFAYESTSPIKLRDSSIHTFREREVPPGVINLAALGVDIGSVSTKAALITRIDGEFRVIASHYRRTEGNPVEAVKKTLEAISHQISRRGYDIKSIVAATTGSGRYLTGYFIGANLIKNEITAQAAGTTTYLKEPDITVIEIGGQDSKFFQICGGSIVDFEMNWACAAGTGALIEKHAKNLDLDIRHFGDLALKGDRPPIINSTCAVFSEAALLYYQQNNVSVENLCAGACLASARNYLAKVVRNRPIGRIVAFQGAVAFNKGMVGAFETILGRPIIVPPYPHLTGCIGAARIAYEEQETNPSPSRFRGFCQIINADYRLTSFQCKGCGNECHVNRFEVEGESFFQGDRCDRYSSTHKKSKGENLPDLFAEREELLLAIGKGRTPKQAATIGIPRGLLFSDYFPFFGTFFAELGFNVIASEKTNKRIIGKGIEKVLAEFCFPIKVVHGHASDLLEQGVDYLFLPAIVSTESPLGGFDLCVTCPYVQAAPDVVSSALEARSGKTKILSPTLFLDRGYPHLRRVMSKMARVLGKTRAESDVALCRALEVQREFRRRISERGSEILKSIEENGQNAFIVIGRPYAIHDPALNMDIAKKIRDEGFIAIPLDFLPLEAEDVSDSWPNIYSVQGQKKMAAARLIRKHKNLHALVLTYFACGPDAFLDQMFKEEIGRQYLTIQIDEHTSDTGVLTRIQAYLSSAQASTVMEEVPRIRAHDSTLAGLGGKKLWIPYMSEGARLLASVMRAHGLDAEILPRSSDPGLSLARQYICGDVCTPMLFTTEDMLTRATMPDFNPEKEAFFQGKSGGPCRFGMYFMVQKLILDSLFGPTQIVTVGNRNNDSGLGTSFTMMAWDALVTYDMLEKMLLHTRPYEAMPGASDELFSRYVDRLCAAVLEPRNSLKTAPARLRAALGGHLSDYERILKDAQRDFAALRVKKERKPLVGVVGEFFVRLHEPSNQCIVRKLESFGAEIWLAPMTEFFGYSNYITGVHAFDRWRDAREGKYLLEAGKRFFLSRLASRDEHRLYEATLPYLEGLDELKPREVVELGALYVNKFFGGEAIMSMGKSEDFARRNFDGVVSVGPFNCMPSMIVSALSRELRRRHNNIPYLCIDYDGFVDAARDLRISLFMSAVRERFRAREGAGNDKSPTSR